LGLPGGFLGASWGLPGGFLEASWELKITYYVLKYEFLTASYASLTVLGIAFFRNPTCPFPQFVLYFVIFVIF
jgi:hypothetical protein